ncbi:MAG: hypothetical protein KKB37_04765, partial [Alphaproteobacteria bacterium]|nr:hypothetical protein [Alphaproteobacteria bacterium]
MSGVSFPARFLSMSPMGWWRPGDVLGFDFTNDRYMRQGIPRPMDAVASTLRATSRLSRTEAGVLVPFGANVAAITDRGLHVEEARVNKCRNFNANPT